MHRRLQGLENTPRTSNLKPRTRTGMGMTERGAGTGAKPRGSSENLSGLFGGVPSHQENLTRSYRHP